VELSDAGVRLRCGVELKLPDDVVLVFGRAVDHVASDPEPGPVDRITVECGFPGGVVLDRMFELERWHVVSWVV
jgi:hypothetical protein